MSEPLARSIEAQLKRSNYVLYGFDHCQGPIAERVVIGTRWRRLVHRYIDGEIGICAYLHRAAIPDEPEGGDDFAVVFKKSAFADGELRDIDAPRDDHHRGGIRSP